jgi:hypothetical protein
MKCQFPFLAPIILYVVGWLREMTVRICFVSIQLRPLELNLHLFVTARMILWSGASVTHEIKEINFRIV